MNLTVKYFILKLFNHFYFSHFYWTYYENKRGFKESLDLKKRMNQQRVKERMKNQIKQRQINLIPKK
jgi:hypothetical protein